HLGGSEANAIGLVHRLEHVGDECADARVDRRNGPGYRMQARIRVGKDWKECHGRQMEPVSLFSPLLPLPVDHSGHKHCPIKDLTPESPATCQERTKTRWLQPRQLLA